MPTPSSPAREKRALRKQMLAKLRALPAAHLEQAGRAVATHLRAHLLPGDIVALFASLPHEISTGTIDAACREVGATRLCPRIHNEALVFHQLPSDLPAAQMPLGAFHVPTPDASWPAVPLAHATLILVPGVAFDDAGHRMGYGRGFYDRALAAVPSRAERAVGLHLDEQRLPHVPTDPHDIPLARLCSPSLGLRTTSTRGSQG